MIVHHLNAAVAGGAAIAARRLHHALPAAGVDSRFCYSHAFHGEVAEPSYERLAAPPRGALAKLSEARRRRRRKRDRRRFLRNRPGGSVSFTMAWQRRPTPCPERLLDADILHLHWIAEWIDYETFFGSVPDDFPIVWTFHDMNPLTGGCHYSDGCRRFETGCRSCPELADGGGRDLSFRNFRQKALAIRRKNLHVVTPSRWLEDHARRSRLLAHVSSVQTIHNGVDTDVFSPRDRRAVRRTLNLPEGCAIVAFGADSLNDGRKGFAHLVAALGRLASREKVLGLVFGGGAVPSDVGPVPQVRHLGHVSDPNLQAAIYSAADVLVLPSLQDNLPNVGIEAMACGTPVVAFDVGGLPDYVRPPETGLLVPAGDVGALAKAIDRLVLHPDEASRMGAAARALAQREFHHEKQARKYAELYRRIVPRGALEGRPEKDCPLSMQGGFLPVRAAGVGAEASVRRGTTWATQSNTDRL